MVIPAAYTNDNAWNANAEDPLWLLTPEQLDEIPDGTILHSIMGERAVFGKDVIDGDTRFGYLAYGLRESQFKYQVDNT